MAIITLSELKTFLGISGTSEDAQLTPMVAMVNKYLVNYVDRDIEETTYEDELYDGPGTVALTLRNYPIIEVSSVMCNNIEVEEVSYEDRMDNGTDGYWIKDPELGILWRSGLWPRGRGIILISYTAGYETIPDDVKYAAYVAASYLRRIQKKIGIISESLGSYAYSLANPSNGKTLFENAGVAEILDDYKRLDVGMEF